MTACRPLADAGPCGPGPCDGSCAEGFDSDPVCEICACYADYVTEDLETLCEQCTAETGAEIRVWLGRDA
jgi:hypothetical protein